MSHDALSFNQLRQAAQIKQPVTIAKPESKSPVVDSEDVVELGAGLEASPFAPILGELELNTESNQFERFAQIQQARISSSTKAMQSFDTPNTRELLSQEALAKNPHAQALLDKHGGAVKLAVDHYTLTLPNGSTITGNYNLS